MPKKTTKKTPQKGEVEKVRITTVSAHQRKIPSSREKRKPKKLTAEIGVETIVTGGDEPILCDSMASKACDIADRIVKINKSLIYLDNNATTPTTATVAHVINKWTKCCVNPSSNSNAGKMATETLRCAREIIAIHCGVTCDTHRVIFTGSGSESNCFIIRSACLAYAKKCGTKPHIVVSSIEHHSVLACVEILVDADTAEATFVKPNIYGFVPPSSVRDAIKDNTCIVSVMHINNEIGVINDIAKIAEYCHEKNVPFHTDAVQSFGKYRFDFAKYPADAVSASAHKFFGPKGVGFLILNMNFVNGYDLKALIAGSQQFGLRGGTEDIPNIIGAVAALQDSHKNRAQKNTQLLDLRNRIITGLSRKFRFGEYKKYAEMSVKEEMPTDLNPYELVLLGVPLEMVQRYTPNTLLLSVAKNKGAPFCNIKLRSDLEYRGVIVGIGSACLTKSSKASHVLESICAPPVIKRGTIRISMSDLTTEKEIDEFIEIFNEVVKSQMTDI